MLLAAEANHRISNNLTALSGFVRLKASRLKNTADARAVLVDIAARIEMIGRLHRLLASKKSDQFNVASYLREVCDAMKGAISGGREIAFDFSLDTSIEAPSDMGLPFGMLAAELLTNAVKYAHPTGVALKIELCCRRLDDDAMIFTCADDGVGFPEGFDPKVDGRLGLQLIHSLVAQMRGACKWESGPLGLCFAMEAPLAARRMSGHAQNGLVAAV